MFCKTGEERSNPVVDTDDEDDGKQDEPDGAFSVPNVNTKGYATATQQDHKKKLLLRRPDRTKESCTPSSGVAVGAPGDVCSPAASNLSLEERVLAYEETRRRIFGPSHDQQHTTPAAHVAGGFSEKPSLVGHPRPPSCSSQQFHELPRHFPKTQNTLGERAERNLASTLPFTVQPSMMSRGRNVNPRPCTTRTTGDPSASLFLFSAAEATASASLDPSFPRYTMSSSNIHSNMSYPIITSSRPTAGAPNAAREPATNRTCDAKGTGIARQEIIPAIERRVASYETEFPPLGM